MSLVENRARRDRIEAINVRLHVLRGTAARTLWEYGTLFGEVDRDELWRETGASSFADWVENRVGTSRETVRKAMLIARHFTADMAERFGTEKLMATLRYLDATDRIEQPGDVMAIEVRLRAETGQWSSVPYAKATYRQLLDAAHAIQEDRRKREASKAAPEKHVRERARQLAKALPAPPRGTVRGDRVKVTKAKDGRVTFSFQGIPADDLRAFVAALHEHLIDGSDTP